LHHRFGGALAAAFNRGVVGTRAYRAATGLLHDMRNLVSEQTPPITARDVVLTGSEDHVGPVRESTCAGGFCGGSCSAAAVQSHVTEIFVETIFEFVAHAVRQRSALRAQGAFGLCTRHTREQLSHGVIACQL
jgi:hypothetical protein